MSRAHRLVSAALAAGLALSLASAAVAAPKKGEGKKPAAAEAAAAGPDVAALQLQAKTVFDELKGHADANVRRAVFEGQAASTPEERTAAIAWGLEDPSWDIRGRALALSLVDKDKKRQASALEALTKVLTSGEAADRARALQVVEGALDPAARLKLLEKIAKEGVPEARADARAALIKLGGKPAWTVLQAGLADNPDSPEFKQAIATLEAGYAEPMVVDWALAHYHDKDALGPLARAVLVRISEPKAVAKLQKALQTAYDKEAFAERIDAAAVLANRGQGAALAKTLATGARFREQQVRLVAWEGLKGVRDKEVLTQLKERITTSEAEPEATASYEWLYAWAKANAEPAVYELLQEVARSDRRALRMKAMDVLTRLEHRPSAPIFEASMNEGQTEVRLAAAKGLAAVARAGDEPRLAAMLRKEPEAGVKEHLVKALGRIGTPATLDALQFVVNAPQKDLKIAAMTAIAAVGNAQAATLLRLNKRDPDVDARFLAWHQSLRLSPKEAMDELKSALAWFTAGHVQALVDDAKVPVEVLAQIAQQGNDEQRTVAVDGLAKRGDAAATRLLDLVERSPHEDTAAQALVALAAQRKQASVPTYRAALESKHVAVRAAALQAIAEYGPPALVEVILPLLSEKDPLVRARAAETLLRLAARPA